MLDNKDYKKLECITFIHIFLIAAALQYEESMGYCVKPDGKLVNLGGTESKDIRHLVEVLTKESCLSQCLLVEGVKGCEYERVGCSAIMVEVSYGNRDPESNAICWRFFEKGELLYAEKQYFSEP